MDGFRVITTTYIYFKNKDEAVDFALKGRGLGRRTEVITEDQYSLRYAGKQMQDLIEFREGK